MTRRLAPWLALAAIAVAAAGACRTAEQPGPRLIVLGIDGMDYRVTRELIAAGRMPNFARLASVGTFAPLATSMPPQSAVAWSSVITGLDAPGHGIFDFVHRDPTTMAPYLSTSKVDDPARNLTIGSWRLPLAGGRVTSLRAGVPFWDTLEADGVRTTIIRMPANYPPSGSATRELSGMGTPDLLGTYGTFSFFTTSPSTSRPGAASGARIVPIDVVNHVASAELLGPDHPFRTPARRLSVPLRVEIDRDRPAATIVVGGERRRLDAGQWSDWVAIEFPLMPLQRLRGIGRFYLKQVRPTLELYVSPINLDPLSPAMPISTPSSYAAHLARATGRFHTQGMAEDTKALNEGVFTRDEFLQQAAFVGEEVRRQYFSVLDEVTNGLIFYYFGNLDQVSHMFWRARDPEHPAYDATRDAPYARVIDDLYVAFDQLVGETLRRIGPDATLIVLSDHGFTSWRRTFHLNSWLRDHGYLATRDPARRDDAGLFQHVDWSRTRAYGLGLNGLYVNLRGRERDGTVAAEDRDALVEEIRQKLLAAIDPATGRAVVTSTARPAAAPLSPAHAAVAPDLVVGYAAGTRVSNESALGGLSPDVLVDNRQEWSGDHCMDPAAVPGILLTSRPLRRRVTSLMDVGAAIVAEFGH